MSAATRRAADLQLLPTEQSYLFCPRLFWLLGLPCLCRLVCLVSCCQGSAGLQHPASCLQSAAVCAGLQAPVGQHSPRVPTPHPPWPALNPEQPLRLSAPLHPARSHLWDSNVLDIRRCPPTGHPAGAHVHKHSEWCLHQYRSRFPRPLVRRVLGFTAGVPACLPSPRSQRFHLLAVWFGWGSPQAGQPGRGHAAAS